MLTHPEEFARLLADPSQLPVAVEELLRFTSPLNHATDPFTTRDMSVGGALIPAGKWVFMAVSSANRDPDRFTDPDRLDLSRDASGHLAHARPGIAPVSARCMISAPDSVSWS